MIECTFLAPNPFVPSPRKWPLQSSQGGSGSGNEHSNRFGNERCWCRNCIYSLSRMGMFEWFGCTMSRGWPHINIERTSALSLVIYVQIVSAYRHLLLFRLCMTFISDKLRSARKKKNLKIGSSPQDTFIWCHFSTILFSLGESHPPGVTTATSAAGHVTSWRWQYSMALASVPAENPPLPLI